MTIDEVLDICHKNRCCVLSAQLILDGNKNLVVGRFPIWEGYCLLQHKYYPQADSNEIATFESKIFHLWDDGSLVDKKRAISLCMERGMFQ